MSVLAFIIRLPAELFQFTSRLRFNISSTLRQAMITVAWFLLPINLPISGYDIFVYLRARYMLSERAVLTVLSFLDEWTSAVVIPKKVLTADSISET